MIKEWKEKFNSIIKWYINLIKDVKKIYNFSKNNLILIWILYIWWIIWQITMMHDIVSNFSVLYYINISYSIIFFLKLVLYLIIWLILWISISFILIVLPFFVISSWYIYIIHFIFTWEIILEKESFISTILAIIWLILNYTYYKYNLKFRI